MINVFISAYSLDRFSANAYHPTPLYSRPDDIENGYEDNVVSEKLNFVKEVLF